jgi:hypothetical protein
MSDADRRRLLSLVQESKAASKSLYSNQNLATESQYQYVHNLLHNHAYRLGLVTKRDKFGGWYWLRKPEGVK